MFEELTDIELDIIKDKVLNEIKFSVEYINKELEQNSSNSRGFVLTTKQYANSNCYERLFLQK